MTIRLSAWFGLAAALALPPAFAQAGNTCTVPGLLVSEDPAGDDLAAPTGEGFGDIRSLHMAEPGGNKLVFTYKMTDLALLPPDTFWAIRFITDALPAGDIQEYFVAMVTGPDATPHLVYGTAGNADPAGQAGLMFTPQGTLADGSGYSSDGTITLVLDKSKMDGLQPGGAVFGMVPLVHRITPTDGTQPFVYGFRSVGGTLLAYDEGSDGFYAIVGSDACGNGKSFLGIGALPWGTLALLALAGLAGLRRFAH